MWRLVGQIPWSDGGVLHLGGGRRQRARVSLRELPPQEVSHRTEGGERFVWSSTEVPVLHETYTPLREGCGLLFVWSIMGVPVLQET